MYRFAISLLIEIKIFLFYDLYLTNIAHEVVQNPPSTFLKKFGVKHFIYQINRLTTTKVDSTYLG